jgi:hypothetical protein
MKYLPAWALGAMGTAFCAIWPAAAQPGAPGTVWPDPPGASAPGRPTQTRPAARPPAQAPAAAPAPAPDGAPAARPAAPRPAAAKPAKPATPKTAAAGRAQAVACDGPFSKDSSHIRLAQTFGNDNVVFTTVDGPEGTKLNASVVFPKDPKRRLEVLWHDEEKRTRPSTIVVNGSSSWSAPKGLKVGSQLADVEKQNGKPFKISGFDWDNGGAVTDWDGGALDSLPGGCRIGVRFAPDPKAPKEPREKVVGDTEFPSTDPNMRAVKPKVSEMLIGYPQ